MIRLYEYIFVKLVEKAEKFFNGIDFLNPLYVLPIYLTVAVWFFGCIVILRTMVRVKRFFKLMFMLPYARRVFLLREVCATCKHLRYQHEFAYNMSPRDVRCGVGAFISEVIQHYGSECWCPKFTEMEPLDLCDRMHEDK